MKTYRIFLTVFLGLVLGTNTAWGQVITANPEFPTPSDSVTITFDATEGSQGLMDYDGDVYAHTGITVNGDQWQYVIAEWSENIDKAKLNRVDANTYEFKIKPSIRQFYGAAAEDEITELCFVFRSSDGNQQTNDLFYQVYNPGLQVSISKPTQKRFVAKQDEAFTFEASASEGDSIELYAGDELLHTATGNSLSQSLSFSNQGAVWLWVKAFSSGETATDSVRTFIRGDVPVAELPDGIHNGVNYTSDTSAVLVLHAPGKEFAFAIGDFSTWQVAEDYYMNRTPDNTHFWVALNDLQAGKEYRYQYFVDSEITIADPYTEKVLDPWNDQYISGSTYPNLIAYPQGQTEGIVSVFQTAAPEYEWEVTDFEPPANEDLVIYELLVRDFTEDGAVGDLYGVMDKLDYLDSLGVNAIELMPVNEFEGNDSWGYNPSFYFAFDKAYGRKQDLKAFVDSCHKRGIAVIADMVLNHSYGQSPFVQLYFNPDAGEWGQPTAENPWYNQECPHPPYCWGSDFNHQSQATQNLVDSINSFWLEEYNMDGFRFDFTKGFTNNSSTDQGWSYDQQRVDVLKRMADEIWTSNQNAYVILEHFAENSEEQELTDYGMMVWGNMNHSYNEATMGWHEDNNSDFSWISYKNREMSKPHVVGYMESHDEERLMYKNLQYGNSLSSYDIQNLSTALDRIELAANFFIPVPGPKMIWQFGELGYDFSINYDCRVCKKPVKWSYYEEEGRRAVYDVFAALNHLKTSEPAFSSSDFSFINPAGKVKELVIRHSDMDAYIVGNFDVKVHTINPNFPAEGKWYEFYSGDSIQTSELGDISLSAGEYQFYTTKKLAKPDVSTAVAEAPAEEAGQVHVYPNPAGRTANLHISASQNQQVLVRVFNTQGQLVQEKQHKVHSGATRIPVDVANYARGMYIISVSGETLQTQTSLIKH